MNEHIKLLIEDLKKLWIKLDINQKFSIAALVLVLFIVGIFFIFKATEPDWTVLYSDLSKQDVAAIAESLKKSGHAYKISEDKTAILVRNQDKENLRMFVAENDLIKDSTGGFELLDSLQLGSTDFKNKMTKQRIFQGELTRSIEKIQGVKKARVQLAEPERSIFSDNDEEPSASVVLILEPNVKLKASQILSIKNLVAYSIPRLTNDRVFLTDQFGNVLSEDVNKNSTDMQTYRANFEKEAAKKIKDTLETIMGKDNVSVQVSAVMDFNQTKTTLESYTPAENSQNGVILTSQGEKESYSNPQPIQQETQTETQNTPQPTQAQINAQNQAQNMTNQGIQTPNALELPLNNTPSKTVNYNANEAQQNGEDVRKLSYEKEKQATTYAVTKEVKQVVYAPGSVVRLSVAVAVNKILTEAEKDEIKSLVQAACGMDISRGDVVNVSSLKFTGLDDTLEEKENKQEQKEFILEILTFIFKNLSPIIIVLIIGLVALKTFSSSLKVQRIKRPEETQQEEPSGMNPVSFDPYLALQQNESSSESFYQKDIPFSSSLEKKKKDIINTVMSDPEEAARIITSYIKE